LTDLDANSNPIVSPSSYSNTSNPQTVYIKLTNTISDCYLAIPLDLIINLPPAINQFENLTVCANEDNYYNLLEINNILVNTTDNTNISYYTTAADAQSATNPLDTNYTYTSNNTTLFTRVEDATT